jgi:hypothetical protein
LGLTSPIRQLPQRLVRAVQGFQHVAPLFVFPLVQPMDDRPLEAFDPGFQSGIPFDLPLPL